MLTRTTSKTINFTKPFVLGDFDEVLPSGDYIVEMDEELLQGVSFNVYRRIAVTVRLTAKIGNPGLSRALTIDPRELEKALARDQGVTEQLVSASGDRVGQP